MGILLPVLGVMSVTSEWSQRTAMVTFTLEPSRVRVVGAKLASILIISVAALAIGLVLGSLANVLYGALSGNTVVWGNVGKYLVFYLLLYVFGMVTGFAFGSVFLNSPAGIVVYFVYSFVLPGLLVLAGSLMDWFEKIRPWIDFNNDQNDLIDGTIHGTGWPHLVVSGLLWMVLPLAIGVWRIRRAEVK
jgi:ABC-type transport system involved in multi-copper enzyme maturation permease subunit